MREAAGFQVRVHRRMGWFEDLCAHQDARIRRSLQLIARNASERRAALLRQVDSELPDDTPSDRMNESVSNDDLDAGIPPEVQEEELTFTFRR